MPSLALSTAGQETPAARGLIYGTIRAPEVPRNVTEPDGAVILE
jgi:hypothetical protein